MSDTRAADDALAAALRAAVADPTKRPDFYRVLIESTVYVVDASPAPHGEGRQTLETGRALALATIDIAGVPHVPVFSSMEQLSAAAPAHARYLALQARALFGILGSTHVLLNPKTVPSKQLTPPEIAALLDGSIFAPRSREVVASGRQVMLGQPAEYPVHLTDALGRLFATRTQVRAAYLAHYLDPASGTAPHTLIGIDQSGAWDQLVGEASLVLEAVCRTGEIVDFVKIDGSAISQYMTNQTEPFYQRRS